MNADLKEDTDEEINYRITETSLQPNLSSTVNHKSGFKSSLMNTVGIKTSSTSYPTPSKNSFLLRTEIQSKENSVSSPIKIKTEDKIDDIGIYRHKSQPKLLGNNHYSDDINTFNEHLRHLQNNKFTEKLYAKKSLEPSARQKGKYPT